MESEAKRQMLHGRYIEYRLLTEKGIITYILEIDNVIRELPMEELNMCFREQYDYKKEET